MTSVACAVLECSLSAAGLNVAAASWLVIVLGLPPFVVGAGFTWSGLRPEPRKGSIGGLA